MNTKKENKCKDALDQGLHLHSSYVEGISKLNSSADPVRKCMESFLDRELELKEIIVRSYVPDGLDPFGFLSLRECLFAVDYSGVDRTEYLIIDGVRVGSFTSSFADSALGKGLLFQCVFHPIVRPQDLVFRFEKIDVSTIHGLNLSLTCSSFPEQYDVFDRDGNKVAYFRLRHDCFYAECPEVNGTIVYENSHLTGGEFTDEERFRELSNACVAVNEYIAKLETTRQEG